MFQKAVFGALVAVCLGGLAALAAEGDAAMVSKVDFGYAFSTPHRMAVARPDDSDKTLLDLEPGSLKMVWTYENLLNIPVASFMTPAAVWGVRITPKIDDQPLARSVWSRGDGFLPILDNTYDDPRGKVRLEVVGGETACIVRATLINTGTAPAKFSLVCESQRGFFGYNPGYVDPDAVRDCLLAGWGDRADRVIVLAVGADESAITNATTLNPILTLQPGETKTAWVVRPYRGYEADLPALRARDWAAELDVAKKEWSDLLGRSVRIRIPDPGVTNGFYACLGDLFIMREPVQGGYIAATPGTDGYRAANAGEAGIVAIALDQVGLHELSADGYRMCFDQQGDDGNWADPKGWGHLMWCMSGFKSWVIMEHYRLTGDRAYLEAVYPRMLASSRWQEKQRARARVMQDGQRPLTYGLMPRGMGDCGLKDGDDLYGVFLPHNIWSVYADRCSMEAAEILGKKDEAVELRRVYETAMADLMQSLDKGAIVADGYRWIPGVPGKTSGSRWGALNALFPCRLLEPDNELIVGTLKHIRSDMSPGGLPLNTGWMPKGMWVAIALDNLAESHLLRGESDEAADLLYATLNHGTPLYTWCEERGQEPGAKETTGDRQHLWTPVAVVRYLRDALVMEDGSTLHLARGTHRDWLGSGQSVGITSAPTHFGEVTYEMSHDPAAKRVRGKVVFPDVNSPGAVTLTKAVLHLRLPGILRVTAVNPDSGATVLSGGNAIEWPSPSGEKEFDAKLE